MARICFVLESFPQLSETFILDQMESLECFGHEVHVVADYFLPIDSICMSSFARSLAERGVARWRVTRSCQKISTLLKGRLRSAANRVFDYISDSQFQDYDLLIAHFGFNGLRLARSKKRGRFSTPIITIFHGYDVGIPDKLGELGRYSPLFEQSSLLITVNEYFRKKLIGAGAPSNQTIVHHMGVDCSHAQLPCDSVPQNSPLQMITVSRLVEKKGIKFALFALDNLRKTRSDIDFEYRIFGSGPAERQLRQLAIRLHLQDKVKFMGPISHDDVRTELLRASVFILPSVTAPNGDIEGIPVSLMEAMASGRIVISSFHSGIPELIQDRESGFLSPEGEADSIASNIAWIFDNPQDHDRIRIAARKTVINEFNKETLNPRFADIVSKITGKIY